MKKIFVCGLAFLLIYTCLAHEYILLPAKFYVGPGDELELHLFVADGFNIQIERPFQKAMTKKFVLITGNATVDLANTADAALPVINRKVDFEGGALICMERDYARIALPTAQFLDYLKEDHIENIAPSVNKAKREQKERYSRWIKALVQSGQPTTDTVYKMITGQRFEIILLHNPSLLHKGGIIKAKVLFEGKPLAGKIITARNRTGSLPALSITARTDAAGICSFRLEREGDWFLHATHMIACPDPSDSDWESFWASYSFGIRK